VRGKESFLAYYDVGREGAIYCIGEESIGHTYTQKLCISIPGTIQKEYMNSRYKNRIKEKGEHLLLLSSYSIVPRAVAVRYISRYQKTS